MDLLMRPERLPRPGVTVLAPTYELLPGGKGANQAHACAMARENGTSVHFVGAVGADAFGDSLRAAFADAGVGVSGLVTHETLPTACAAVIVDGKGENQIAVGSGANRAVVAARLVDHGEPSIRAGDVLLQQMEIPIAEVIKAADIAHEIGAFSVLNVAPSAPVPEETLRKLDFLVVNEHEAEDVFASLLQTNEDARDVAADFFETSGNEAVAASAAIASTAGVAVIVTLGAEGAAACLPTRPSRETRDKELLSTRVDVFRVAPLALVGDERVVDTTGAGDAFVGAFCASLASNRSLPECLQRASVAGTLGCTRVGARAGVPRIDEIRKRAVGVAVVAEWGDDVDHETEASMLAAPAAAWTRRGV